MAPRKKTILAAPDKRSEFDKLCDTLTKAERAPDAPARKLLPKAERMELLSRGRAAFLRGDISSHSLTTLEKLLECGAALSPKLRAALAAVPMTAAVSN
jgi:hypothetical protein